MCNRVRASFEFRETKIRWNLFNDLPDFRPSNNIGPDRGDILTVVRSEAGNEGRLMGARSELRNVLIWRDKVSITSGLRRLAMPF